MPISKELLDLITSGDPGRNQPELVPGVCIVVSVGVHAPRTGAQQCYGFTGVTGEMVARHLDLRNAQGLGSLEVGDWVICSGSHLR
jgi:hypothetical protein